MGDTFGTGQCVVGTYLGDPLLFCHRIPDRDGICLEICRRDGKFEMEGPYMGNVTIARIWNLCLHVPFLLQPVGVAISSNDAGWIHFIGKFDVRHCGVQDRS